MWKYGNETGKKISINMSIIIKPYSNKQKMKKNLIALAFAGAAILAGTTKTNAQLLSNGGSLSPI